MVKLFLFSVIVLLMGIIWRLFVLLGRTPTREFGFASARVVGSGLYAEGDIRKMRVTNTQDIELQFRPVDIHGNPTDEYEKGSCRFFVLSGDESLVEIIQNPNLELSAIVRATGLNGVVQIGAEVDGDPGDGRDIISASGALEIVSSRARSAQLIGGVVREQGAGDGEPTISQPEKTVRTGASDAANLQNRTAAPDTRLVFSAYVGAPAEATATRPSVSKVVYSRVATREDVSLFFRTADLERLPQSAPDIDYLVTVFGARFSIEDFDEASAQAQSAQDEGAIASAPSQSQSQSQVVVDENHPARFPMIGGAQVVEAAMESATESHEQRVAQRREPFVKKLDSREDVSIERRIDPADRRQVSEQVRADS